MVKTLHFQCRVQSLVRELRSHMPHMAKKKKSYEKYKGVVLFIVETLGKIMNIVSWAFYPLHRCVPILKLLEFCLI